MTDLADIVTSAFWRVNPPDADPQETREWLDAFDALVQSEGRERATFLLRKLLDHARARRVPLPPVLNTPYKNSIGLAEQPQFPGNLEVESRISAIVRWNALAMVVRANRASSELGGHIASYASAADLFEVGFNHFFHADDLVYFQPHSAPGVYARAFLEGRLPEERLAHYRQETSGKGLSSYCHPYLMPEFWQFPTGSMGLGPLNAVYQARFMRYLEHRGVLETHSRKVWAFVGDGEMDEPESLAGLSLAAREGLDNLIFVVNCNLQRLDGPVRGNGSIVQELEGLFAGAGWNVLKLLWGSDWDALFARDHDGVLLKRRIPDVRRHRRALQPRALLQQVPRAHRAHLRHERRGHRSPAPRRPRSGEDLRRLSRSARAQGTAHRDPCPDQERLRHGALGAGQDGHAPAKEARRRGAA